MLLLAPHVQHKYSAAASHVHARCCLPLTHRYTGLHACMHSYMLYRTASLPGPAAPVHLHHELHAAAVHARTLLWRLQLRQQRQVPALAHSSVTQQRKLQLQMQRLPRAQAVMQKHCAQWPCMCIYTRHCTYSFVQEANFTGSQCIGVQQAQMSESCGAKNDA